VLSSKLWEGSAIGCFTSNTLPASDPTQTTLFAGKNFWQARQNYKDLTVVRLRRAFSLNVDRINLWSRHFLTLSSFRRVRFAEDSCFDVLRLSVVRLLISVAICFAIGLFVLVQVAIVI